MSTMIDCQQALMVLQDWLRQEVTPETAAQLEAHLQICAPCRDHAEFESRFIDLVERAAGTEGCPTETRTRLLAALRRAQGG